MNVIPKQIIFVSRSIIVLRCTVLRMSNLLKISVLSSPVDSANSHISTDVAVNSDAVFSVGQFVANCSRLQQLVPTAVRERQKCHTGHLLPVFRARCSAYRWRCVYYHNRWQVFCDPVWSEQWFSALRKNVLSFQGKETSNDGPSGTPERTAQYLRRRASSEATLCAFWGFQSGAVDEVLCLLRCFAALLLVAWPLALEPVFCH
jgi:hypothetical protein